MEDGSHDILAVDHLQDTSFVVAPQISVEDATTMAKEMVARGVVEITPGFPARDAQQLYDIFFALAQARNGIMRIPIVAVSEPSTSDTPSRDRIYMLTRRTGKNEHQTLWKLLGSPPTVSFTTSIEGISLEPSTQSPLSLELPNVILNRETGARANVHLPLGLGSDMGVVSSEHPLTKPFTDHGKAAIQRVFSIPNVTYRGFA